ncbi:alkaline phosphatase family protein [Blastococcus colisei]|uniref:alkaline phosphatase family protein n=1 Tax=Blastococcus colisei TaxID=1564162 RepID=UPI001476F9E8
MACIRPPWPNLPSPDSPPCWPRSGTSPPGSRRPAGGRRRPLPTARCADYWDGFDPAFLDRAVTPTLDALAEPGDLTVGSSTFQTVSNPGSASMSTGAYPDTHENAAYYLDAASNTVRGQERYLVAVTHRRLAGRGGLHGLPRLCQSLGQPLVGWSRVAGFPRWTWPPW